MTMSAERNHGRCAKTHKVETNLSRGVRFLTLSAATDSLQPQCTDPFSLAEAGDEPSYRRSIIVFAGGPVMAGFQSR
jgi:hypothetical protein